MTNQLIDEEMPAEIDFSKATRGRHQIPVEATFSEKAGRKGVGLSQLLTEVLKRDIEINEAHE
jgi:hypothetical protein